MPYENKGEIHHCWCSKGGRSVLAPHGDHHDRCPIHEGWFFRRGQTCILCEEDRKRKQREERQAREKAAKNKKEADENAFFKDTGKTRKPRSHEKEVKGKKGKKPKK